MATNFVLERTTTSDIAHMVQDIVRTCAYQCGSLTVAYHRCGQMIGRSDFWVRSLIKGYRKATVDVDLAEEIKLIYARVVLKIDCTAQRLEETNAANARLMAPGEGLGE